MIPTVVRPAEVDMVRGWPVVLALLVGCGSVGARSAPMGPAEPPRVEAAGFASVADADQGAATTRGASYRVQIETGSVSLEVDAYEPARAELVQWVEGHGGHLANETLS